MSSRARGATPLSKLTLSTFISLAIGSFGMIVLALIASSAALAHPSGAPSLGPPVERLPSGPRAEALQEPPAAREVSTVFFRVVSRETRHLLPGVTLKVLIDGKLVREHVTDESGRIAIPIPAKRFHRLSVTARKDGLAPIRVDLRRASAPEIELPRSYTLAMARASSIGGIVRDEDGHPVAGASATVQQTSPEDRVAELIDLNDVSTRTDQEGRWHIDLIPEGFELGSLQVTFSHPDFLEPFASSLLPSRATPEQLRNRSAVIILHRGISVTGRVMDRDGRPLAGASVRLGDRFWSPAVQSDADGRFRFRSAPAGDTFLTVQAAGRAPEARSVRLHGDLQPIEFRLGPGRTIRGRVADSQQRPIAGAEIYVVRWNGPRTLKWRSSTDAEGRFVWDSAPTDQVWLGADKEGYRTAEAPIEAFAKEAILKLTPASLLRIRGTVVDGETGRPIDTFTVVPIVEPGRILLLDSARAHHAGRYVFTPEALAQPYRVRIEAKGYRPALSPALRGMPGNRSSTPASRRVSGSRASSAGATAHRALGPK